jgi:hypothetical protein
MNDQKRDEYLLKDDNGIEMDNPIARREREDPEMDEPVDLGDEERVEEVTSANQELDAAHGDIVKEGGTASDLEQGEGPEHSVDEHMPAGSESPEDKVNDIINSGILRI